MSYEVGWPSPIPKEAYVEVAFYFGGFDFAGKLATLRVFQADEDRYRDVTQGLELERRVIRARIQRPGTLAILNASKARTRSPHQ